MKTRAEKTKFLQRFLGFCYSNLDKFSPAERQLLGKNLSTVLGFEKGEWQVISPDGHIKWEVVKNKQREAINKLNWVFDHLIDENISIYFDVPYSFSSGFLGFFCEDYRTTKEKMRIEIYDLSQDKKMGARKLPAYFEYVFKALDGFPSSSLLKCPRCDKIFFNPTARRKTYCSTTCQNASAVERFREKQKGTKQQARKRQGRTKKK